MAHQLGAKSSLNLSVKGELSEDSHGYQTYTVALQNESGEILLQHTEGQYDFESPDKIQIGKQQSFSYPPEESFGADDYLTLAAAQESNGELPVALKTYKRGLARFPDSISLNRAAGRLEVALNQYGKAVQHLSKALAALEAREGHCDRVSKDCPGTCQQPARLDPGGCHGGCALGRAAPSSRG
jgi:tetratricopeptide (TPR) repeat protein